MAISPFADLLPEVGDPAPRFELAAAMPGGTRGTVSLDDLIGHARDEGLHGVIVYFYPEASTPGCTVQACDFRDSLEVLRRAGYVVVGISPDEMEPIEEFRDAEALTFPLASDPDHAVADAYNVFGEHNVMGHFKTSIIRSTFVVGTDGTLTHVKRNAQAKGHVARLLRDLEIA